MAHTWTKVPARTKTLNRYVRDDGKVIVQGRSRDYRVYDVVNGVEQVRRLGIDKTAIAWWRTAREAQAAADKD